MQGGMGQVVVVYDESLARTMALKTLKPEFVGDRTRVEGFLREAKVMMEVKGSDFIVTSYLVRLFEDRPGLLMEFVDGQNLRSYIGRLSLRDATTFASQISRGMWYLHELMRIAHLDIKPENVLITAQGVAKLTDFGLGSFLNDLPWLSGHGLAVYQSVSGTCPYMSPEQWSGRGIGKLSDMYSFGVLLFELLTGQLPFRSNTIEGWMRAHITQQPPAPSTLRNDIAPTLSKLVLACLQKEPERRPQSFWWIGKELARTRLG
jgi:serine/threonine protein kinase